MFIVFLLQHFHNMPLIPTNSNISGDTRINR